MKALRSLLLLCVVACSGPAGPPLELKHWDGDWLRSDGTYRLEITVKPDGTPQVAYFNPNPIHVEKAEFQDTPGGERLLVTLRDQGYPGATYQLSYAAKEDVLVGVYHNPNAGQPFAVSFARVKK